MKYLFVLFLLLGNTFLKAQGFRVGDKVDMYSTDGNYYAASVLEVSGTRYKIRFDAFAASADTWVDDANLVRGGRVGDKIIVVSEKGTFYGVIKEVQNTKYKIVYDGYPDSYELTRKMFNFVSGPTNAPPAEVQQQQPAPVQTASAQQAAAGFVVGARLQALEGTVWYNATIKEIKNGKYLIKYDDYDQEALLPKENLRFKPTLPAAKLKPTSGKTYVRSIRWIATGNTELSWYFLGDNGVIVANPVHGSNPINLALEQTDNFKNVGTYTITNDLINVQWLSGQKSSLGLKYRNGEIIEMDAGGIMVRQKGLPDNYRIGGTYNGSISFGGGVASVASYTFTRDGRIARTQTGRTNTADAGGMASNNKTGTYTIKGNTLFITFNDGTKETANIGVFSGMPGKLVLNNVWMSAE